MKEYYKLFSKNGVIAEAVRQLLAEKMSFQCPYVYLSTDSSGILLQSFLNLRVVLCSISWQSFLNIF